MTKKQKKPKRPRRNVVMFLVEGDSELNALSFIISAFYEKNSRLSGKYVDPVFLKIDYPKNDEEDWDGGDITSFSYYNFAKRKKVTVNKDKIFEDIDEVFFGRGFENNKIMYKDIVKIIHLVDLDGAYIPDECIIEDKRFIENKNKEKNIFREDEKFKTWYEEKRIVCNEKEDIKDRNKQKRGNIDFLVDSPSFAAEDIPYYVYYFSTNLDHFLHTHLKDNQNLKHGQKTDEADKFRSRFKKEGEDVNDYDFESFVKVFTEDPNSATFNGKDYKSSWDYIKDRRNNPFASLARGTNFDLFLNDLYDEYLKAQEEKQ